MIRIIIKITIITIIIINVILIIIATVIMLLFMIGMLPSQIKKNRISPISSLFLFSPVLISTHFIHALLFFSLPFPPNSFLLFSSNLLFYFLSSLRFSSLFSSLFSSSRFSSSLLKCRFLITLHFIFS